MMAQEIVMKVSEFDYKLPEELIAQEPADRREESRLMLINRRDGTITHERFFSLPDFLVSGDLLVLNDTRVFPARILGKKSSGGASIEVLLLEDAGQQCWKVMARRARRLKEGTIVRFSDDFFGTVDEVLGEGLFLMRFSYPRTLQDALEEHGQVPLPPYISRDGVETDVDDRERYQTVYARHTGSAAAPTAGLHFTEDLLDGLSGKGIEKQFLTLNIGLDTFQPVKAKNVEDHRIHSEKVCISPEAAAAVNDAKSEGRRVIAVGTTSVRALESGATEEGSVEPMHDYSRLFIVPGYRFRIVDAMLTNFHLPRSTLLMLVSAFMGNDLRKRVYEEAVRERYRFYSYGDAMLIV